MAHEKTSELCLEIRVSAGAGDPIELENADGKIWRREPTELPETLSSASLWERLDKGWPPKSPARIESVHSIRYAV